MRKTKRKRNNWRGPLGEETVYAVVFWWQGRLVSIIPLLSFYPFRIGKCSGRIVQFYCFSGGAQKESILLKVMILYK